MLNVTKGDKIVVKKDIDTFGGSSFAGVGDVYEITDVSDKYVTMRNYPSDNGKTEKTMRMSFNMMNEYFDIVKDIKKHADVDAPLPNTVTSDLVDCIFDSSEVITSTVFGKCTIMACKLPNNFVIVESSACVDPDNYNKGLGEKICERKIKDRIGELEGYMLSSILADDAMDDEDDDWDSCEDEDECDGCAYFQYCHDDADCC